MKRLLAIFLSMSLLAFGIFHVLHDSDSTLPGAAPVHGPAVDRTASVAVPDKAPPVAGRADTQTPPWLLPAPRTTAPNSVAPAAAAADAQERIARLNVVLAKLNHLQAQPNIDAKAASAAIAELEQINGSPVMNGVRLDVLRENVEVADRIQTTAAELQRLQQSTATPSSDQTALVQSKTAELSALQSRLRSDIRQSPDSVGAQP